MKPVPGVDTRRSNEFSHEQDALQAYEEAIRLDERNHEAMMRMARLYCDTERPSLHKNLTKALKWMQQAVQTIERDSPDNERCIVDYLYDLEKISYTQVFKDMVTESYLKIAAFKSSDLVQKSIYNNRLPHDDYIAYIENLKNEKTGRLPEMNYADEWGTNAPSSFIQVVRFLTSDKKLV